MYENEKEKYSPRGSPLRKGDNRGITSYERSPADTWIKFFAWFMVMGVLLGYGMLQHNDTILLEVMIVVTTGCGFGTAIDLLLKFLGARPDLNNPPKS